MSDVIEGPEADKHYRRAIDVANRELLAAEAKLADAVRGARAGGWSWQKIADAFGVSRQAAWQKWMPVVEGHVEEEEEEEGASGPQEPWSPPADADPVVRKRR